jgi:malate dehydrogenase (oxaloacetate-decarboxylating)(NADP+)
LGVIVSGATRVTDEMFMAAAHTLAEGVTEDDLQQGSLYPPLKSIRDVSAHIAAAVAAVAYRRGAGAWARAHRPLAICEVEDVRTLLSQVGGALKTT